MAARPTARIRNGQLSQSSFNESMEVLEALQQIVDPNGTVDVGPTGVVLGGRRAKRNVPQQAGSAGAPIKTVFITAVTNNTFTVKDRPSDPVESEYEVYAMSYPPNGGGRVGTHDLRDCYPVRMAGYPLKVFFGTQWDGVDEITGGGQLIPLN